jgi:hypothetical protein
MIAASNENIQRAGMPGGFMSLSWDGHDLSTATLWCTIPVYHNGNRQPVGGELVAFDASSFDHQPTFSRITSALEEPPGTGRRFCHAQVLLPDDCEWQSLPDRRRWDASA